MLQYRTHAEKDSCYNTPPTFGIYLMGRVFRWLIELGGLERDCAAKPVPRPIKLYDVPRSRALCFRQPQAFRQSLT